MTVVDTLVPVKGRINVLHWLLWYMIQTHTSRLNGHTSRRTWVQVGYKNFAILRFPLTLPLHTYYILFNTIPQCPSQTGDGSEEMIEECIKYNISWRVTGCRAFVAGCLPVASAKTPIGIHPFFNCQQTLRKGTSIPFTSAVRRQYPDMIQIYMNTRECCNKSPHESAFLDSIIGEEQAAHTAQRT